ncbi:hypothetical protein [Nostoc sp. FACHB-888]|uniref:hypothetical protein n=1 Tax=Nostoc sp. FACHB-888 TaxID=2692842 RepID=UPI00168973C4|nr:hypothetical protein [Nostoc sp. FACHB-888]MBD2249608.1 hypothetical protein [Nostoc sp. FACHB-888]
MSLKEPSSPEQLLDQFCDPFVDIGLANNPISTPDISGSIHVRKASVKEKCAIRIAQ